MNIKVITKYAFAKAVVTGLSVFLLVACERNAETERSAQNAQNKQASSQDANHANKYTHFSVGNGNVKSMYSENDIVWIGTSSGVVKYNTKTDAHQVYDNRSGLLSNGIFYVGRVKGQLAVGTYGGGLSLLVSEETGEWKNYNIQHGLGDAFIYDVLEMQNGDVWIATWSGANRIRGGDLDDRSKWDLYTVENTQGGLPNDWVYGLAEGKNGEVWMATEGGLARFVDDKWSNWTHEDGQGAAYELVRGDNDIGSDPAQYSSHHARQKIEQGLEHIKTAYNPNYIVAMEIDDDGSVWVGTWGGGLGHFKDGKWENMTVKDGLPSNHIFKLHKDKKGRLWVGTSKGMAEYIDGNFRILTTRNGLFSNNVFSMALDSEDNMWVGSYGGVAKLIQQ